MTYIASSSKASTSFITSTEALLPIVPFDELRKKALPDLWSEAHDPTSPTSWALSAFLYQSLPEDLLATPVDQWPTTFPQKWLSLLKTRLEEDFQEIPTGVIDKSSLHLLLSYGMHHFQTLFNQVDQESREWLIRRRPISTSLIICKNLERQPLLEKDLLLFLSSCVSKLVNNTNEFNLLALTSKIEWYQNIIANHPPTKTFSFIKKGDWLKIFLCQFYLPQVPPKERRSALDEMLDCCDHVEDLEALKKDTHLSRLYNCLNFLGRCKLMTQLTSTLKCLIADFQMSQQEERCKMLDNDAFIECGDIIYGFSCLTQKPLHFNLAFAHLEYLPPLISHKKVHAQLLEIIFPEEVVDETKETLTWIIYKMWWYKSDREQSCCFIDRLIHWHAVDLFVDQGLWFLGQHEFIDVLRTTLQTSSPMLPFYSHMAEGSFWQLHALRRNSR